MFPCRYYVKSAVTHNPEGLTLLLRKSYSSTMLEYATGSPLARHVFCDDRSMARQLQLDLETTYTKIKQTKELVGK